MKNKHLLNVFGEIDDKHITEAAPAAKKSRKPVWMRWVAVATCFALVAIVGIPIAMDLTKGPDQSLVDNIMLIEYNNAYYEIIENNDEALIRHGVTTDVSESTAGRHLAYLQKDVPEAERSNYLVSDEPTDYELYEYAPVPEKSVVVFRDGEKYYIALFCNYLVDTDRCLPITDAFVTYGVDDATDVASITPVKDNEWKADGSVITDKEVISEFYSEITSLPSRSFDEYHELVYAEDVAKFENEENGDIGQEAYNRVADDLKIIVVETNDGLRFAIRYYPSYGWINVQSIMSYFQMTPEMSLWFENNIN